MKYNYTDIGMTEEYNAQTGQWQPGDLMLTAPALDYNLQPIAESIGLQTKRAHENLKQIILFRFLTRKGDYVLRPLMGHSLDLISGRRMTKDLIAQGKALIQDILTYDTLFEASDIEIVGFPFDSKTLHYNIAINVGEQQLYRFNINYTAETGEWTLQ